MQRRSTSKTVSGAQRQVPGKGKGKRATIVPATRIQRSPSTSIRKPQQPKRFSVVDKPRVSTAAVAESKLVFAQHRLSLIDGRHASVVAKDGHLSAAHQVQIGPGHPLQGAGGSKPVVPRVSHGKIPVLQHGPTPGKFVHQNSHQGKQVAAASRSAPLPSHASTPGKVVHTDSQGKFPVAHQESHGKVPLTSPANAKPNQQDGQTVNSAFKEIKEDDGAAGGVPDIHIQPVSPVMSKELDHRPRVEFKILDRTDRLHVDIKPPSSLGSAETFGTDSELDTKAKHTKSTETVREKGNSCQELARFCKENPTCYRLKPNYPEVCPRCNDGHFKAEWTPLSVFCFVCVPLLGIPCCYAFREYTCTNCGEIWEYDDPREEIPTT